LGARVAAAIVHATPDWSAVLASRIMGAAARMPLPPPVGRAAVMAYARMFGVNLRDVDPLALEEGFATFDDFFTRKLRRGARAIDRDPATLVSPCDGELREIVPIERVTEVVAKGCSFSIGELLADEELAERFVGGTATTIYLHPKDYHRVHTPCDALAHRVTLVPGRLLPVTSASVARDPRVFAVNERMIHVLETGVGWVAVVMVAAFGVGNMSCAYHRFNPHPRELQVAQCKPPARLEKGSELGIFHLGSTVIVLAEGQVGSVHDHAPPGLGGQLPKQVLLGEPLLREIVA
jgi:phosphatidylserine decarboxylase